MSVGTQPVRAHPDLKPVLAVAAAAIVIGLAIWAVSGSSNTAVPQGQTVASTWAAQNPQMWSFMRSHWDEMALFHEHWGDTAWMQSHLPDWSWMQQHWPQMSFMYENWPSMSQLHSSMMGSPGSMMGQ